MGCSDSGGYWGYNDHTPRGQRADFPDEYVAEHGLDAWIDGLREDAEGGEKPAFLVALDAMKERLDAATKAACELASGKPSKETKAWVERHRREDAERDKLDPAWRDELSRREAAAAQKKADDLTKKIARLERRLAKKKAEAGL